MADFTEQKDNVIYNVEQAKDCANEMEDYLDSAYDEIANIRKSLSDALKDIAELQEKRSSYDILDALEESLQKHLKAAGQGVMDDIRELLDS